MKNKMRLKNWSHHRFLRIAIACFLCMILGTILHNEKVKAASSNVIFSTEEESIEEGAEFVVTVTIDAEEKISGVEMIISYDSDALEFVNASPQVSGEEGTLKISDTDIVSDRSSVSYLIKFRMKKVGTTYVKVTSNPSVYNESSGQSMSVASNVLSVVGVAPKTASNNSNLKSLKLSGGTLNPEFSKDRYEYTVTVEEGKQKLFISAEAEDVNATVKVEGGDKLLIGENEVTVIVTAQNGDTTEYKIIATYEETVSESNEETTELGEEGQQEIKVEVSENNPIAILKQDENAIITTYGVYTIEPLPEETILPKGYSDTTLTIDGVSITVYENMEQRNDFVLVYASREGTEPTFYQYDKKEQTLQRMNQLLLLEEAEDNVTNHDSTTSTNRSKIYDILLIALVFLCVLFMVITTLLYRKVNFYKRRSKSRRS